MVMIWDHLAYGDREAAAVQVALNWVFPAVANAALGRFCPQMLPGGLGLVSVELWAGRRFLFGKAAGPARSDLTGGAAGA